MRVIKRMFSTTYTLSVILNADFAERRTRRPHEERNHVQRPFMHGAGKYLRQAIIGFRRRHPIIVGTRLFLLLGANKSQILGARHIVERAAVQITARQLFFVQGHEIAGFYAISINFSFSSSDPSHQKMSSGWHMAAMSFTHFWICRFAGIVPVEELMS
jgi:hypothetical protein